MSTDNPEVCVDCEIQAWLDVYWTAVRRYLLDADDADATLIDLAADRLEEFGCWTVER
jgi:hypothetical protein